MYTVYVPGKPTQSEILLKMYMQMSGSQDDYVHDKLYCFNKVSN